MRTNERIATTLDNIAYFLEREYAHPFRVRAYRRAAQNIRDWPEDIREMVRSGDPLISIPGVGIDLARRIEELVRNGTTFFRDTHGRPVSSEVVELFRVPGLGRRRVEQLFIGLGVSTLRELREAVRAGRVRGLPGFGPAIEARINEYFRGIEREKREKRSEPTAAKSRSRELAKAGKR